MSMNAVFLVDDNRAGRKYSRNASGVKPSEHVDSFMDRMIHKVSNDCNIWFACNGSASLSSSPDSPTLSAYPFKL
jgi:hypothetical protein